MCLLAGYKFIFVDLHLCDVHFYVVYKVSAELLWFHMNALLSSNVWILSTKKASNEPMMRQWYHHEKWTKSFFFQAIKTLQLPTQKKYPKRSLAVSKE